MRIQIITLLVEQLLPGFQQVRLDEIHDPHPASIDQQFPPLPGLVT
nr:hypothetical protein [Actinoplanes sp. N902-109]